MPVSHFASKKKSKKCLKYDKLFFIFFLKVYGLFVVHSERLSILCSQSDILYSLVQVSKHKTIRVLLQRTNRLMTNF